MQLTPSALRRIGMIDPRFQSYNVEMIEVTGGRFWAPYAVMAAGGGLIVVNLGFEIERHNGKS